MTQGPCPAAPPRQRRGTCCRRIRERQTRTTAMTATKQEMVTAQCLGGGNRRGAHLSHLWVVLVGVRVGR
eukprot:1270415-Pleurochrysis_carterae.AAC.1